MQTFCGLWTPKIYRCTTKLYSLIHSGEITIETSREQEACHLTPRSCLRAKLLSQTQSSRLLFINLQLSNSNKQCVAVPASEQPGKTIPAFSCSREAHLLDWTSPVSSHSSPEGPWEENAPSHSASNPFTSSCPSVWGSAPALQSSSMHQSHKWLLKQ